MEIDGGVLAKDVPCYRSHHDPYYFLQRGDGLYQWISDFYTVLRHDAEAVPIMPASFMCYLYRESFQFMRMGNSCAIAWILFVIIMILTAILFKFQNRWVYYGGE